MSKDENEEWLNRERERIQEAYARLVSESQSRISHLKLGSPLRYRNVSSWDYDFGHRAAILFVGNIEVARVPFSELIKEFLHHHGNDFVV